MSVDYQALSMPFAIFSLTAGLGGKITRCEMKAGAVPWLFGV